MGRPLMGYNLEPKNSFTGLLHPDVLGWIMGGKGEEKAEKDFCPKPHPGWPQGPGIK